MPIYDLWQPDNTTINGVQVRDDAHAVAIFGDRIGIELTLEEGPLVATYMMRRTEEQEARRAHWVKRQFDIPVWVKDPDNQ